MINKQFKNNWFKILDYNKKTVLLKDNQDFKTIVRIPLTPIEIDAGILQELFELFYPQFINDQQNILDLIISDDENNILESYLYRTRKAGIHESVENLPLEVISDNIFPFKKEDLKNIDLYFNKLQLRIVERKQVRISSVRIFKQKFIDSLNKTCNNLDSITMKDFLKQFFDFLQQIYDQRLFYIHPSPTINYFIKDFLKFLKGIKLSRLVEFLIEIFPESKISFLFRPINTYFILDIYKNNGYSKDNNLLIKIRTLDELGTKIDNRPIQEVLYGMIKELKSNKIYYINLNGIIDLLHDIFGMKFPPKKEKIEFIIQKGLYGIRSYEKLWYGAPRIKLFNLKRYFIRIFGLNLNVKKLSHWATPQIFLNLMSKYLGLKFKLLIILTDTTGMNLDTFKNPVDSIKTAAILDFENASLKSIIPILKKEIISDISSENSIEIIRSRISKKRGYITAIICINEILLLNLIDKFLFDISSLNLFAKLKILKMFKNEIYFNMYPVIPLFKVIKDYGPLKILKMLTSILFDKHEF